MNSKKRHEGYLLIDHSNSPGIDPSIARAAGFEVPDVRPGQKFETATITCSHCQAMVIMNPSRVRPRNYCSRCDHYICDHPACNRDCLPIAKVFDDFEKYQISRSCPCGTFFSA